MINRGPIIASTLDAIAAWHGTRAQPYYTRLGSPTSIHRRLDVWMHGSPHLSPWPQTIGPRRSVVIGSFLGRNWPIYGKAYGSEIRSPIRSFRCPINVC